MNKDTEQFAKAIKQGLLDVNFPIETCEGMCWLENKIKEQPDITITDLCIEADKKISEGTADDGWLKVAIKYAWSSMNEEEHILFLRHLSKRGAHKSLMNWSTFLEGLTNKEANVLEDLLRDSKHLLAADNLKQRSNVKKVSGNA